jgi:hypothetical protein
VGGHLIQQIQQIARVAVFGLVLCSAVALVPQRVHSLVSPTTEATGLHLLSVTTSVGTETEASVAVKAQARAETAEVTAEESARKEAERRAEEQRLAAQRAAAAVQTPAKPPPAVDNYGPGEVQNLIRQLFAPLGPDQVVKALRVAACESGYNPRAYNPVGPYYGVFQFTAETFRATIYGNQDIYSAYYNVAAAAWKVSVSGWGAWGCQ